jgi:predicted PurR-regulated permease PerM
LNGGDWTFFRRLLMVAAVAAIGFVVWQAAPVLMLLFGAILIAILLKGLADMVETHTFVSERWSFAIVTSVLLVVVIGVVALFGTQISGQIAEVFRRAPEALDAAGEAIGISNASERLADSIADTDNSRLLSGIAGFGYSVLGGLTDLVVVIVAAIYLAADPRPYRDGVANLFPKDQQSRILETMNLAAVALRQWFSGQLVSMLAVGVASGIAFWAIGLPSPIGLGIIAGASNFVPLIGPLVGAVPALLLAFLQEPITVLWVAVAILAIQQVEGNLLMPLVQRRAVDLPPAVALLSILVFGALFGILGVVFAMPLAVLTSVLVEKLWVRETLGVETTVPGEPQPAQRRRRMRRRLPRAS